MAEGETVAGVNAGRRMQRRRVPRAFFGVAKQQRFIDALAATCNVRIAAEAAGVRLSTPYAARRRDPAFAERWDEALAIGYQRLEAEALNYALERIGDLGEAGQPDVERGIALTAARGNPVGAMIGRRPSDADLRFVLALLGWHHAAAHGRRAGQAPSPATEAETDAKLATALDRIEKRLRR